MRQLTFWEVRSLNAALILAVVDLVLFSLGILWLIFVCGGGSLPPGGDPDTKTFYLHAAHGALVLSTFVVFAIPTLFVPAWFSLAGLAVMFVDVFAVINRYYIAVDGGNAVCTVVLGILDAAFLLTAFLYVGFAISAAFTYGPGGESLRTTDETLPLYAEKEAPDTPKPPAPVLTPSGSFQGARNKRVIHF